MKPTRQEEESVVHYANQLKKCIRAIIIVCIFGQWLAWTVNICVNSQQPLAMINEIKK